MNAASPSASGKATWSRYRLIVQRALPIIGGMMSQNVLNLVDTWMVGQTGTASLAAVAVGGMLNFFAVATLMGLSVSVQTLAARRHGAEQYAESAAPLNGAILVVLSCGIPLTLLFVPLVPGVFERLHPDPAVATIGGPYLVARLLALAPSGLNFAFRGYWNGTNRSQLYLITLLVIHASNILFNWLFIFGHWGIAARGAAGAGYASAIATTLGCACYFGIAWKHAKGNGFLTRWPPLSQLRVIASLALPTSVQQMLFAAGFTAQFWIVGKLGTEETGVAGVLLNVMLVAILPGLALGITATSFVSQALGKDNTNDAYRWGLQVAHVSMVVAGTLALPMWLVPDWFLSPFLTDPSAIAMARWPLRIFATGIVIDSAGTVLQQALLGAGDNRRVMKVSVAFQWGLFLPGAFVLGPLLGYGLSAVWSAHASYRVLQSMYYMWLWRGRSWTSIRL